MNKLKVCQRWRIQSYSGAGWFIFNDKIDRHLHKDLQLHSNTGYRGGKLDEAPGYWPTKEAAEDALKQYLRKEQK